VKIKLRMNFERMVEAVGIEPTSEKHNPKASTCVVLSGDFAAAPQERTSARCG